VLTFGAALLVWAFSRGNPFTLPLGGLAIGYGYHNYPLLETGRPRIGAGQYGLFVEGLGVIAWRAIESIDLIAVTSRGVVDQELSVTLREPVDRALIADWRRRPLYRMLMRLPWSMKGNTIRIGLEPFDQSPTQIHQNLMRLWQYFRT